jgi:hypothetical protein
MLDLVPKARYRTTFRRSTVDTPEILHLSLSGHALLARDWFQVCGETTQNGRAEFEAGLASHHEYGSIGQSSLCTLGSIGNIAGSELMARRPLHPVLHLEVLFVLRACPS